MRDYLEDIIRSLRPTLKRTPHLIQIDCDPALVDAIIAALPNVRVTRFGDLFFDGEAKEAVAFALLGYLHLMGEPGNLPSVTGARGPRILGQLTPA